MVLERNTRKYLKKLEPHLQDYFKRAMTAKNYMVSSAYFTFKIHKKTKLVNTRMIINSFNGLLSQWSK